MKSIDALLDRQYDPKKYHCVHFLIEAAQYLFEKDYSASFLGLTGDLAKSIQTSRDTTIKNKRIERPKDGCIVLMTNLLNSSHVGLFYCGRVLHLSEIGVHFQELRSLERNYSRFRFYEASYLSQ
ncbi:hypothetical protein HXZ93_01640 [Acinetobacter pseudolwoffii]|uniref:hypothetical protein n=1 Tax=Acinetobacter pseudolwoffii TaxID=2053287 RepID=UPI0025773685|nr:hypothetical protein [Acinetobacter pseudolwoffii]MDM1334747.1 hypothetical protein [Acinetobacter pseudolwoffii]